MGNLLRITLAYVAFSGTGAYKDSHNVLTRLFHLCKHKGVSSAKEHARTELGMGTSAIGYGSMYMYQTNVLVWVSPKFIRSNRINYSDFIFF